MTKLTVDLTKDMANIDPIRSARLIKEGNYKKVEQLEKEKTISLGTLKKRLQEKAMAEINMEQKTETLIEKLRELKATRNDNRSKEIRKSPTQAMRKYIFQKTGGKCHICGGNLDKGWYADHVLLMHLVVKIRLRTFWAPVLYAIWHAGTFVLRRSD